MGMLVRTPTCLEGPDRHLFFLHHDVGPLPEHCRHPLDSGPALSREHAEADKYEWLQAS